MKKIMEINSGPRKEGVEGINSKVKAGSMILLSLAVFGCSFSNVPDTEVVKLQLTEKVYVAEVRKNKGASISFRINSSTHDSRFTTHANTDGSSAKTPADIDHYLVYLVKNAVTTGYPANGDPIAQKVAGPFNIPATGATQAVTFSNIPSSGGEAYYVAVRAIEKVTGNDIIKENASLSGSNKKIAVSSGNGIIVTNDFTVSSTTNLIVTASLQDITGAALESVVTPNNGSASTSYTASHLPLQIITIAGGASSGLGDGGDATAARFIYPQGIEVDSAGNVYIADYNDGRIRKVNASDGKISTIAGDGSYVSVGDGGDATAAGLRSPTDVAVDSAGNVYIADSLGNNIRKVNASDGKISTIAGDGSFGYGGDGGNATDAQLHQPYGVAVDSSGNVYIADRDNHRIRKVNVSNGKISTIAGDGTNSFGGDGGDATAAQLSYPNGVAVDSDGNVYIVDSDNHRIRKVNVSNGKISTIAGDGTNSFGGDGGDATAAQLSYPNGVAVDSDGNVYIADTGNNRIRKVNASDGKISTIAGNGTNSFGGDGSDATAAQLSYPLKAVVDSAGTVYISDSSNNRIRKLY